MKTKTTGLILQDLGNKSFTIKTPSNQINPHCLLVACGKSKSGKGLFYHKLTSPTETSWFYGPYISGKPHRKIE